MKRIVLLLTVFLVFGAAMGLWANGGSDGGAKQLHIGVAAANFDDKWMSYMHDGFREAAEKAGVKLTMVDGKNDPAVQQGQIETLVTQGVDAIVIVPVQIASIGPIMDEVKNAGIPLVAVNRPPDEPYFSQLATYVGSDEVYAGTVQAEKIVELLGGKGDVVIIHGQFGHPAEQGRTQGNKAVLAKYPDIKIVREDTSEWQRAKALQLVENWIQSGFNIDAVLANNDESAIGAAMALEQVGLLDQVLIAGVDATPDALYNMRDGKLDVTVFQDAYGQGYGGIEAAIKAANGEDLPPRWDIPYEVVTPDLVDKYLAKWGE
jgi:inositol transport system substrate-binding protein